MVHEVMFPEQARSYRAGCRSEQTKISVIRAIECGKVAPALLLYVPAGLPYEEWIRG
jgi:hypothetical protein